MRRLEAGLDRRERRERETDAGYLVNATDLTGKFDTGIINHTLTAGVEHAIRNVSDREIYLVVFQDKPEFETARCGPLLR